MKSKRANSLRYTVVIEKADGNFSAYVPDLPGCVATGRTRAIVLRRIAQAIHMHVQGLKEDGLPVPKPAATAEYVETAA